MDSEEDGCFSFHRMLAGLFECSRYQGRKALLLFPSQPARVEPLRPVSKDHVLRDARVAPTMPCPTHE